MNMLQINSIYVGLSKLRFFFMVLLIGATVTQIIINKVQLIPLLVGCLVYCLLGGQRMINASYRILIVLQLGCCLYLGLKLLYMELDYASVSLKSSEQLVSILVNLAYLVYGIILTWRNYQVNKCTHFPQDSVVCPSARFWWNMMMLMMRRYALNYGMKNFKTQFNLQHLNLKGTLRRFQRRYPKTHFIMKFTFTLMLTGTTMLLVFPGTLFPFQKNIKLFFINQVISFGYWWHFTSINPNPISFMDFLYNAMEWNIQNNIYNQSFTFQTLKKGNDFLENPNYQKLKNDLKIKQMNHSIIMLAGLAANNPKLLQQKLLVGQYERTFFLVKDIQKISNYQHYLSIYKLFQYLLVYSENQQKVLTGIRECFGGENGKILVNNLSQQTQFRQLLRSLYLKAKGKQKQQLTSLFNLIDKIYR